MEILTNDRLIRRNARIGQICSIAGLIVLGVGLYISFARPELFAISLVSLLVGFGLSQIGIYFGNRWGKRPRPDQQLNEALKGLDGRYSLYHYTTPTSHLLVGPAGVWVLMPRQQGGTITYDEAKKRWQQKGGNWYLKIFAQESLGRPDLEIGSELDAISRFLAAHLEEDKVPEVNAALIMTNDTCEVDADNAPAPTLEARKLKDFIRKTAKGKPISLDLVKEIQQSVAGEN
ncbi:MAG: hypothetical protein JSV42_14710 [Chloroflexota bacterium]|nr:MAG: hypothetical protein JSV42_14710 [Chloroflexota bacterium]